MKSLSFFVLVSFFALFACGRKIESTASREADASPKTLLLSLRIEKKGNDYHFTIPSSRIIDAPVKNLEPAPVVYRENDFLCFIQDRDKKNLDTLIVLQPLHPRYEFPGEEGAIGSKPVELQENEVLLRFAYTSEMTFIQIHKVDKNNRLRTLNTIKIPGS